LPAVWGCSTLCLVELGLKVNRGVRWADPINFQDKLKARQTEQDAELHMEGVDDRLQIAAAAIKEMIDAGHSRQDIAKALQFFATS
jgi:hypothetical protein